MVAQLTARWIRPNMRMEDLWTWTLQCMGMTNVNQVDWRARRAHQAHAHYPLRFAAPSVLARHRSGRGAAEPEKDRECAVLGALPPFDTMLRFVHGDDEATEDSARSTARMRT